MSEISNKEYGEREGIRRSELSILLTHTPMHLKYALDHPHEDSPAFAFGRAAHKYILEKNEFFDEFAVAPQCDRRTKEGKQIYAEFVADAEGKEVITSDEYLQIQEMSEAIDNYPLARQLLTGEVEQSFWWNDTETGECLKCRPDCITEYEGKKYIVDYKTTDSCQDGHFERSVRRYGYKFQAGFYREGLFNSTFDEYGFVFVAQEKKAPYAVRVYFCTDEFINEGYEQFRNAVNVYHFCKENNNWFGYEGPENIASTLYEEGEE